jgi:phytoene dehydrogenase-like protein
MGAARISFNGHGVGGKRVDTTELIDRYCAVWSEPDQARRQAMLSAVWADGATYTDPSVHTAGAEELLAHIANVRERRPGSKVVRTSTVDLHHTVVRFAWRAIGADGDLVRDGIDIAFVSADGARLERIIGFFGPLWHDAE